VGSPAAHAMTRIVTRSALMPAPSTRGHPRATEGRLLSVARLTRTVTVCTLPGDNRDGPSQGKIVPASGCVGEGALVVARLN
jgi:hypothetical protein